MLVYIPSPHMKQNESFSFCIIHACLIIWYSFIFIFLFDK